MQDLGQRRPAEQSGDERWNLSVVREEHLTLVGKVTEERASRQAGMSGDL